MLAASLDNDGVDDDTLTYDSDRASIVGEPFEGSGVRSVAFVGVLGKMSMDINHVRSFEPTITHPHPHPYKSGQGPASHRWTLTLTTRGRCTTGRWRRRRLARRSS